MILGFTIACWMNWDCVNVCDLKGRNLKTVRNFYRNQNSPEFKQVYGEVEKLKADNDTLDKQIQTTMVAKENDKPRETGWGRPGWVAGCAPCHLSTPIRRTSPTGGPLTRRVSRLI